MRLNFSWQKIQTAVERKRTTMKTFAVVLFLFVSIVGPSAADSFLVSLRKAEFLSIIECISISRDPALCAKYAHCEKTMPHRVYVAMQKCQREHVGHQQLRCTKHEPLYKDLVIPTKIFDCVVETIKVLTFPEKEIMVKFEDCAKKLKEESCKVVASHAHRHAHAHEHGHRHAHHTHHHAHEHLHKELHHHH